MPSQTSDIWATTLDLLRGQMTKAMYDRIFPGSSLITENGGYTIELQSDLAVDWAENRLRPIIERALADVTGQREMAPAFVTASRQPAQAPLPEAPAPAPSAQPLAELNYRDLWFGQGTTGYSQRPHYAEKFWQAYLGRAYSLWSLLLADNRQNRTIWTKPKKYRYKYLARALGCGPATISGGRRPCFCYENARLRGQPLTECCGRYHPVEFGHLTGEGVTQCLHWNRGLIEILYGEGLLAVELQKSPNQPNSHVLLLQTWMILPVLTPKQVSTLSDAMQLEHEGWLENIARQAGFDVSAWEGITEPTLVPRMAGREEGRVLVGDYSPSTLT